MAIDLNGIVTWLKGWFYDKSEVNTIANSKLNANLTTANKNLVTNGSGDVVLEDKPTIPDISGKIDTAGTGLSKSGTTLNHSNSVTAQSSAVFKKIKYDGQGHITGTANVGASDLPSHSHSLDNVTDDQIYSYIEPNGSTIRATFRAIDLAIGDISSIRAIEVVSSLPTASSSTMGKLYIISENSKVNVYYTVTEGQAYEWHKMDTDILDELSISWNDITNKPSSFTPSAHVHPAIQVSDSNSHSNIGSSVNDNQGTINSAIDTALSNKAPKSHASSSTTYGVGTSSNYGHNKVINNLTTSTYSDGNSLSAYQGYVLKGLIDDLEDTIVDFDASNIDFDPSSNIWGEYVQVVSTVAQGLDMLKEITNVLNASIIGKQDVGDCITSIELVPKSSDATGAIRLYYGDET